MKLTEFFDITGDQFIYYPKFVHRYGISVKACIFLCYIGWKTIPDTDGWRNHNVAGIEAATGLSEKEQKNARAQLLAAGLIEEHYARLQHVLRFRIVGDLISANGEPPEQPSPNRPFGGSTKGKETLKEKTGGDPEIAEAKRKGFIEAIPANLQSESFTSSWERWKRHRSEIRKPLTKSCAKMQLEKLSKLGREVAISTINRSIEAGWTGLFPETPPPSKPKKIIHHLTDATYDSSKDVL